MTVATTQILENTFITDQLKRTADTYTLTSPTTGRALAQVANCGTEQAADAAALAVTAFASWRARSAFERAAVLRNWFDLVMKNTDELGELISLEMGKPLREARGEVAYGATFIRWYAEEATRADGETLPALQQNKRIMVQRQPVGPVFAITPWNFPVAMITRKAAPALAAGCSVILKPAEQTPLTALRLAELWLEAGGEPGTLQVLPAADPRPVSGYLLADARIRKITFTGSTAVGQLLYRQAADTMKRISLELGGHAPLIVFEDADLEVAAREALASKFRNAGQTCVCSNRVFVQESVRAEFEQLFTQAVGELKVGNPLDLATDIGPLISEAGLNKVQAHVQDALEQGATAVVGGKALSAQQAGSAGADLFFEPTVLTGVTPGMLIMREETFGPVAPIIGFETEADAVRMANDTPYGLAAYLFTRDLGRMYRVSEALDYGIVGVNDGMPSAAHVPFGGMKDSGIGREGGKWGLDEFLEVKYVSIGI
jgi:succinate-semialdehyde dehydrogenase/glutarate-semialdehyde dehydrogenase